MKTTYTIIYILLVVLVGVQKTAAQVIDFNSGVNPNAIRINLGSGFQNLQDSIPGNGFAYRIFDVTSGNNIGNTTNTTLSSGASYQTWMEFGDGNFTFNPNPWYATAGNAAYPTFAKATGIYTGPTKPPAIMRTLASSSSGTFNAAALTGDTYNAARGALPSNSISIVSNVKDVQNDDEMHFAISYKIIPEAGFSSKLVIGYDGDIFKDLDPLATIYNSQIKKLRLFNEAYENAMPQLGVPTAISHSANNIKYVVIKDLKTDDQERNMFFTLEPVKGLPADKNGSTHVFAYVLQVPANGRAKYLGTEKKGIVATDNELNLVGSRAHDPNFETIEPGCSLKAEKVGKRLDFHIHFQNTGKGPAEKVEVTTTLPSGISLPANIDPSHRSVSWTIAGDTHVSSLLPSAGPAHPINWVTAASAVSPISLQYKFSMQQLGANTYKFIFEKQSAAVVLSPLGNPNLGASLASTMGDIRFTLIGDIHTPDIIASQSSIVFYSTGMSVGEAPVITNTAITEFKTRCDCNCDTSDTPCDEVKKRSRFWQWLFCKECK